MSGLRVSPEVRRQAIAAAAAKFGVSPIDIVSRDRSRTVAHARQYVMWLLRERRRQDGARTHSLPTIGQALGVDHTTVLHAWRAVEKRLRPHPHQKPVGGLAQTPLYPYEAAPKQRTVEP